MTNKIHNIQNIIKVLIKINATQSFVNLKYKNDSPTSDNYCFIKNPVSNNGSSSLVG